MKDLTFSLPADKIHTRYTMDVLELSGILENSGDPSAFFNHFNLLPAVDARVAYEKGEPWQSLRTLAKAWCQVSTAGLAGFGFLQVCSQASKKQLQVIKTRWMMAGMAGSIVHSPLFVVCHTLGQSVRQLVLQPFLQLEIFSNDFSHAVYAGSLKLPRCCAEDSCSEKIAGICPVTITIMSSCQVVFSNREL